MTYTPPHARDQIAATSTDPWRKLRQTLAWQYGPERAASILDGTDPATISDLAAWRVLGQRGEA